MSLSWSVLVISTAWPGGGGYRFQQGGVCGGQSPVVVGQCSQELFVGLLLGRVGHWCNAVVVTLLIVTFEIVMLVIACTVAREQAVHNPESHT